MKERATSIGQSTTVTLGLAGLVIGTMMAGAFYIGIFQNRFEGVSKDIEEMKRQREISLGREVGSEGRLVRIEGKLEQIIDQLKTLQK